MHISTGRGARVAIVLRTKNLKPEPIGRAHMDRSARVTLLR
jgi:hypothetical protein